MEIVIIIVIVVVAIIIYRILSSPSNNKFQVNNTSGNNIKSHASSTNSEANEVESLINTASSQIHKYFQNKEYDKNSGKLVICNNVEKRDKLDFYYRYQSKIIGTSLVAACLIKQGRVTNIKDSNNELCKYLYQFSFHKIAKIYVNDSIAVESMSVQKDPKHLWSYIIVKFEAYVPELVELIFDGSPNYNLQLIKEMFIEEVNKSIDKTFYFTFYSSEVSYNQNLQDCALDFSGLLLSIANNINGEDELYV